MPERAAKALGPRRGQSRQFALVELFEISAGIDIVPYQGGAPMLTDLPSGRGQAGIQPD